MASPTNDRYVSAPTVKVRGGRFAPGGTVTGTFAATESSNDSVLFAAVELPADVDWAERSTASGVFRAFHFNDADQLGPNFGQLSAEQQGTVDWFWRNNTGYNSPRLDTTQKCSGASSLVFEYLSNTNDSTSGTWQTHFGTKPSPLHLFGENSEFFISWRSRIDDGWAAVIATHPALGMKYAVIAEVGRKDDGVGTFPWSGSDANDVLKHVQTLTGPITMPTWYTWAYRRDSTGAVEGPNARLRSEAPGPVWVDQPGYQDDSCAYPNYTPENCWFQPTDEWITFKYHFKILGRRAAAPWNNAYWDVEYKFYAARGNEPFKLICRWDSTVPGYGPIQCATPEDGYKLGRFEFLPFLYQKDPSIAHATGRFWADELILSTQDIRAPYPAWRAGKSVGEAYQLANSTYMGDPARTTFSDALQDELIDAYCGNVADQDNCRWLIVTGGGHGFGCDQAWHNPIVQMRLWDHVPTWQFVDAGSSYADVGINRYYKDGRPAARHTYWMGVYIGPGKMADGKERVGMCSGSAGMMQGMDPAVATSSCGYHDVGTGTWIQGAGFELARLNSSDWFAHNAAPYNGAVHGWEYQGFAPDCPVWNSGAASENWVNVVQDPATHDLWVAGRGYQQTDTLFRWTALTNTWSGPLVSRTTSTAYGPAQSAFRSASGSSHVWDRVRNRMVIFYCGSAGPLQGDGVDRMICISASAPYTVTTINLSGGTVPANFTRVVHDLDNDRYVFLALTDTNPVPSPYRLHAIDPDTGAITTISPIISGSEWQHFHIAFMPDLHCIVWMTHHAAPIWFMPTK